MSVVNCITRFFRENRSQSVLLLLYVFLLCAEVLYFALKLKNAPQLLLLLMAFFAAGLIITLVLFYLLKTASLKIETCFLVGVILLGLCYIAAIGPLKSNDETSHYVGAYWLSNVLLGLDMSSVQMRADDLEFYQKWADMTLTHEYQFAQLKDGFSFIAIDPDLVAYAEDVDKNLFNSPMQMYLFPSIGLSLGRLIGLGAVPTYYMGRVLALVSFAGIAYVAVRNTPIGKPVFMTVSLLPMTLELSSSFSYDGPTIAIAMLLCAFCFKAIYAEKQTKSTLIVIVAASILLVPLKVVYSFIVLLVLAIPSKSFRSARFAVLYKVLLFAACLLTFVITRFGAVISIATSDVSSYSVRDTYDAYSIYDLFQNPLWAAHVFLNSFFERLDFKVFTYLGAYMGQVNITPICHDTVAAGFFVIMLFALIAKSDVARPSLRVILLCLLCFLLSSFAIELTMFIGNAERGWDVIKGVLGRYFIPLTPLLIPLFVNTRLSRDYPTPKALLYGAACLNVFYVIQIYGFIALA